MPNPNPKANSVKSYLHAVRVNEASAPRKWNRVSVALTVKANDNWPMMSSLKRLRMLEWLE